MYINIIYTHVHIYEKLRLLRWDSYVNNGKNMNLVWTLYSAAYLTSLSIKDVKVFNGNHCKANEILYSKKNYVNLQFISNTRSNSK